MIKTVSTRLVYENPWTRVREDVIERADGSRGLYGVIDKLDFTLVIPRQGDDLWLVEQYRYPVQGRFAEFPQGAWHERPDADPAEVARGELREEAGLLAAELEPLGFFYCAYGMASHGCHVFLATGLSPTERAPELEEQDMTVRKVTVSQFEDMMRSGEIRDSNSMAAWNLYRLRYNNT
ncbi:ADP-ribose pyrophosphatase [Aliidongia dinghuensis]|uniref:GDP-mannose pyrophosphatase n=1 Tax=Aliidongia dinghuensis TaxID=1867774 RepID=A0A8J2YQ36_9PROT|nr:NUDIX hydrolase [Aliidongia dinghuensis]GGF06842.1 ADP-ribose pyrophosphatase [Aliidongia dinghuensis]